MLKSVFSLTTNTKHGRMKFLDANLLLFEADMIKKIPLCHTDQADTLTWPFTPIGEYTVKSRYTFLQHEYQNS